MVWMICFHALNVMATSPVEKEERYQRRIADYQSFWQSLMPTYTKLQYAGGMGLLNVGAGWAYCNNRQWETDVFLGFITRYASDNAKLTLTLKQNFIPWLDGDDSRHLHRALGLRNVFQYGVQR